MRSYLRTELTTWRRAVTILLACSLFAAACSSNDSEPANTSAGGGGGAGAGGGAGFGGSQAGAGGASGRAGASGNEGSGGGDAGPETSDAAADTDATAPTDATTGERASDEAGDAGPRDAGPFALTSSAFGEGEVIGPVYRCTGTNESPPLSWTPGPATTQSYGITMIHVGSMTLHWALWDIPTTTTSLPMSIARVAEPPVPAGSKQTEPKVDGSTWFGYSGPCPGGPNQSYRFTLYSLDVATLPGVTTASTIQEVDTAIKAHRAASATLTGTASK